ncbi:RICIN domain-containing protein [Streptomyces sp. NPDC048290]|uniref:RICIN domain-containing protein n=1 Tax=Streptomyces sp. NPDC048290 TaxID=3155811 RepID=UPI00343527F1
MPSPHPPRPPYPPRSASVPGESDRDLLAGLGAPDSGARSLVLLLARHYRAVHDYAVICLAASGGPPAMAATAAFQEVLAHRASGGALRPQLLIAVRESVRAWAAQDDVCALLPALRKPTGGRGLRAARPGTSERRRIAERAFNALPSAAQCLLWHTEVESEILSIPAGLLGIDTETANVARERAREEFRRGCVRAHRELAPTRECRFHSRLLDVPMRRGGALLPDVQRHLMACRYCRHAAEQLSHFDGPLDVLLAETVLGWGARRYLDSRPARASGPDPRSSRFRRSAPAPVLYASSSSFSSRGSVVGSSSRRARAVLLGAGLTSLALLATVLASKGWSGENGVPRAPGTTWAGGTGSTATAPAVPTAPAAPGADGEAPSSGAPSAASVQRPGDPVGGRLRNLGEDLCLAVRGGVAEPGAPAVLAPCSTAAGQQWTYQEDGLLRSALGYALCLGTDTGRRTVTLADCRVTEGEVQYDLTVRGELTLRWSERLALAPGAGRRVVADRRDGGRGQRWVWEGGGSSTTAGSEGGGAGGGAGGGDAGVPGVVSGGMGSSGVGGIGGGVGVPGTSGAPGSARPREGSGVPPVGREPRTPSEPYATRVAQVDSEGSGAEVESGAAARGVAGLVASGTDGVGGVLGVVSGLLQ